MSLRVRDTPPAAAEDVARPSSWSVVDAVQAGDFSAFAEIYRQHSKSIVDYAYSRTGNRPLAEDVASETFLRALRSIRTVHYSGKELKSWLTTIARNIVIDTMRSPWHRHAIVTADIPEALGQFDSPEQDVLDGLDQAVLLRGIGDLSAPQRECVWLRFFANLSVDEVGERMGRNATSVRALQYRAVRRLAEILPPSIHAASG
jgi:RNA polymerase sigma-70 factor (ECF subfamily)